MSATPASARTVRLRVSLIYTLSMLSLMAVAGIVGTNLGNNLGREALNGVTQPDFGLSSRTASPGDEAAEPAPGQDVAFLSEADILTQVKARLSSQTASSAPPVTPVAAPAPSSSNSAAKATPQVGFPIVSKDGGVLMEISGAQPDNGSFVLNVNLRNEGTKSVRFLYSFLDVSDDQSRTLSATAEGLPGELQPLSETFSGAIRIPAALVEGVETLSVSLTDYPDQKIQLKLSRIPVIQAPN